jgi:hypothetical protein
MDRDRFRYATPGIFNPKLKVYFPAIFFIRATKSENHPRGVGLVANGVATG